MFDFIEFDFVIVLGGGLFERYGYGSVDLVFYVGKSVVIDV